MKTVALIKQFLFAATLIAVMNIYSSCDSCSRKSESTETNTTDSESYESATEEDTTLSGDNTGTMNDGSTSSTSMSAASGSGNSVKTVTTSKSATTTKTTTAASDKDKNYEARQQAITDRIENSDAKSAVDKNGNAIRSSGDSGTGSGTGTGSTGNNSKVTTREAQRAN